MRGEFWRQEVRCQNLEGLAAAFTPFLVDVEARADKVDVNVADVHVADLKIRDPSFVDHLFVPCIDGSSRFTR